MDASDRAGRSKRRRIDADEGESQRSDSSPGETEEVDTSESCSSGKNGDHNSISSSLSSDQSLTSCCESSEQDAETKYLNLEGESVVEVFFADDEKSTETEFGEAIRVFRREVSSSPLTPFFQEIVQALLTVTHREDAGESRLRTAAYETLNEVVRCSTDETTPMVLQLAPVIMNELHQTVEAQKLSSDQREKQNELQGLLCGCLQVIIQKLTSSESTKNSFMQYADQIMGLFLRVFACRNATVHEEAMLAIGALAYASGPDFAKYMPEFYKYLEMGLQNFEEYQVCAVTVGVVGDICRALEDKILPYCDGIMTHLLKNLSSNQMHRSVKPPTFSCFGDIALAIGQNFEKYFIYAMPMLQSAAELCAHTSGVDEELIEYTNLLRNGILEAYSGIFQGFKNSPKVQLLISYAPSILQFLDIMYMEKDMDEIVMRTAIGVIGDLADTLGNHAGSLIQQSLSCKDFLNECLASEDPSIKESAEWAKLAISRALSI